METTNSPILRLVGTILGLTLLISLIVAVVGLVLQWSAPAQFSNGFFVAGAIAIVLGTLSITGGFQQRANFPITYAESASQASSSERGRRMMADINQRYGALILMVGTGLLLILISIAISQVF
jgi:hypothetical protein